MAVNFPDSPSNGDTFNAEGVVYAYNSSKGVWKAAIDSTALVLDNLIDVDTTSANTQNGQALVYNSNAGKFVANTIAAGVTVYSAISNLPLSSQDNGTMAFVSGTNRLYIWNGTGWYNIALINTTPSISGASAAYDLATNGTATTVTITATDSEGIPITYSVASDTSGSTATVAQGIGANTNVFTITPSTNIAHAGAFSLTFRASDGVNIATAVSAFTLQFITSNSKYTTALITSVGANNKVNSSDFTDQASTPIAWTNPSSRATQTTFSPYRQGGYSVYCDGNDAVKFNETTANEFTFGTGDFTIEFWVWLDYDGSSSNIFGNTAELTLCGNNGTPSNLYDGELWFSVTNYSNHTTGAEYNFQIGVTGWVNNIRTSGVAATKVREWIHLAVTCKDVSGTRTINIWENGVSVASGTATVSIPNSGNQLSFMARPDTYGQYTKGYMHDVRVTKGEALYTSTFTPPTEQMTAGSNTKLLALRKPFIADELTSPLVGEIAAGDPSMEPFTPYDYSSYSASLNVGSLVAPSATLASLEISNSSSAALELGSSDFAIEFWLYRTGASPSAWGMVYVGGDYGHAITTTTSDIPQFVYTDSYGSGWQNWLSSTDVAPLNMWTHILVTRDSNTLRIFRDGVLKNSASYTGSIKNTNNSKYLGGGYTQTQTLPSHLADFRIIKGSVPSGYQTSSTTVDTWVFTPPTEPLSNVTDTVTLMQFNEAAIIDKSQHAKTITLNGDVKSSTTQTKYLSSSIYVDGTGDYVELSDEEGFNMTGAYTIEYWFFSDGTQTNNYATIFGPKSSSWGAGAMGLRYSPSGFANKVAIVRNGNNDVITGYAIVSTNTFAEDTWHHVAVSRDASNNWRLFVNGTEEGTSITQSSTHDWAHNGGAMIGANVWDGAASYFKGYISDLRVTKGLARYTSNFTAPTAALKG